MNKIKLVNRFTLCFFVVALLSELLPWAFPILYDMPFVLSSFILSAVIYIFPMVLYFVFTKENIRDTLSLYPISFWNIILVSVFAFAIQPIMSFLSLVFSFYFPNLVEESMSSLYTLGFLPLLIVTAIFPALFEEFFARGILLSGYFALGTKQAIFYSALLFGLMHMNPQQVPYAFCVGIFFAYFVRKTGSILASIIPHFIINGTTVMIVSLAPPLEEATTTVIGDYELFLYWGSVALLSLPFVTYLLYKISKINVDNPYKKSVVIYQNAKFLTWEMWLVLLIFIVFGVIPYLPFWSNL
ncbi:MAG: type II CAAX endopeptidase family protein [Bacillota bacterium]